MTDDFTLHFKIPEGSHPSGITPAEMEREFAEQQIKILLDYVTLYCGGQPIRPDGFSINNYPDLVHSLKRERGTQLDSDQH